MRKRTADNCITVTDMLQICTDRWHICQFGNIQYISRCDIITTLSSNFFQELNIRDNNIMWHSFTQVMSYTVKAATVTDVSDSIYTPVLPMEFTDPVICTANFSSSNSRLTSAWVMWILWHKGIRFGVCFDAIIPASWPTVKTSPLWILFSFTRWKASCPKYTIAVATASLLLSFLSATSTICALMALIVHMAEFWLNL